MELQSRHGGEYLRESINDYYQYNPDTLMPLLMLALAAQGKLSVESDPNEKVEFASLSISEVIDYEWVRLNQELKRRIKELKSDGVNKISAIGDVPDDLRDIYDTFLKYDNVTVVQEYHHRRGILVYHSSNTKSEMAERQYATLLLADKLTAMSPDWLQDQFLSVANDILVKSGIQPKRPRIKVAQALKALLKYEGKGIVYNPFAGCALAGAMVGGGENLYVDGDANDKLLAVARLLCYGTGQSGCHVALRDSTKWLDGITPDYVLSTFLGYPRGKSAFDTCLAHCLSDAKFKGKFAGIAAPKDIFEKQSVEMKEALRRDWVDSIVLLPFGEVAILIDASKAPGRKKRVRFYNLTRSLLRFRPVHKIINNDIYADIIKLSDVKKKGYLKSLIVPEIEEQEGCEIITLGDLFEKMPRRTWSLNRVRKGSKVLAQIDRNQPYDEWRYPWMQGIEKKEIVSLFAPAYKLNENCLIVNSKGNLEPRLFDSDWGDAFFQDGFAFRKKRGVAFDDDWLIHELCKPYVTRQLHPYGMDEMLPESFSEDQVLSLKLNHPIEKEDEDYDDELEPGTVLRGSDNIEYTIRRFLGNGNFGFAYTAKSKNLVSGEEKEVVLKEFYPHEAYHREELRVVPNDDFAEEQYADDREKFKKEAEIMGILGKMPDSHIVPAVGFFESEVTGTMYYVMPFFPLGSFDDSLKAGERMSETLAIKHIVIPLCKALNASQKHKILHLDIKPENVLIDESGDAFLTDYGTAKVYDDSGVVTFKGGMFSTSNYAAPELVGGSLAKYDPRPDIFGIAGTIYTIVTGAYPRQIFELDQDAEDHIRNRLNQANCSEEFSNAIVKGLQASMSLRPRNAQEFLNLFPACEEIEL